MVRKPDVATKDRSEVTELPPPLELTSEQIDTVSGGCLYAPGVYGPTLILPLLVAVLIG